MYEEIDIELEKMKEVFGTNTNILLRNGLNSIEAVKEYIEKYPFDEYAKYHAIYYRGIGPIKFKQILEALINMKKPLS